MAELFDAEVSVQSASLDASMSDLGEDFEVGISGVSDFTSDVEVETTEQEIAASFSAETMTLNAEFDTGGGVSVLLPATTTTLGGVIVGDNLKITTDGVLNVDTTNVVEQDNTKPITSAAVYATIGNINALLSKI